MNKSGDFMRRLDVNVLVWSLLLRVGSVAIAQTPAAHGCHDELFRAHDFTLGTWDVFEQTIKIGVVTMEAALDGCAIIETWVGTDAKDAQSARGLFAYSKRRAEWLYAFATDTQNNNYFLGDVAARGVAHYTTEVPQPEGRVLKRQWTLTLQPDGRILEKSIASKDDGRSWFTQYEYTWSKKH
jgi:hypothetical protein